MSSVTCNVAPSRSNLVLICADSERYSITRLGFNFDYTMVNDVKYHENDVESHELTNAAHQLTK